jgi:hypothetical protein
VSIRIWCISFHFSVPNSSLFILRGRQQGGARLHFVGTTAGLYHISIDPASSAFFDASPDLNSIDFTVSRFDTVTVTAPADGSIPEPAGFILAALGALGLAAMHSSVRRNCAR